MISLDPTTPVAPHLRGQLNEIIDQHSQDLITLAHDTALTSREQWLVRKALDLAASAHALDAAWAETERREVQALDPSDPGTLTGTPVDYGSVRALVETDAAQAQDRWTTTAPDLRAATEHLWNTKERNEP